MGDDVLALERKIAAMGLDVLNAIDDWFVRVGDENEFVRCQRAGAYAVVGPTKTESKPIYIYATKPSCVLAAKRKYLEFDELGLISRSGLPRLEDVSWLRDMLGEHELIFLGDMDPVDLMVFAWLREYLKQAQVTYLGISDTYLNQLQVELPQAFIMLCAPSEQTSLSFLEAVFPDFREVVGANCAGLLADGRKIELEAIATALGPPGPLLMPALHAIQDRAS